LTDSYGGSLVALSRKRKHELARLKGQASDLWDDQKDVLDRANRVVREASRHARLYARDEVAPRARDAFDDRVRPAVASGLSSAREAASAGRERVTHDVLPAASTAFGSALALLEIAKDPHVRDALKRVTSNASEVGARVGVAKRKSAGPGRYILVGVGIVALAGIAYAAWQTLRADDDLWIDDEDVTEPAGDSLPS
jgi:hypothetical protein